AVDVFHQLVTASKSKVAHTAADLADYVDRPPEEIEHVLDKLCRGNRILRRVTPPRDPSQGADEADPPARYEIFHDVLADPILRWRAARVAERRAQAARDAA